MSAPVVLVTGGGRGLGLDIVQYLSTRGRRVYAGVRDPDKYRDLRGAVPIRLDVTSAESVTSAIEHIRHDAGALDAVVNNAGYGQYGSVEDVDDATARRQFDVNVFGVADVCRAALPIMREQGSGRIVTISSVAGRMSTQFAGWYAASKFAIEALHDALRLEVAHFGIHVSLIEPAAVRSGFDEIALRELDRTSRTPDYAAASAAFAGAVRANYRRAADPEVVVKAVWSALDTRRPKPRYVVPPVSAGAFVLARRLLSDRAMDRLLARQLGPRGAVASALPADPPHPN